MSSVPIFLLFLLLFVCQGLRLAVLLDLDLVFGPLVVIELFLLLLFGSLFWLRRWLPLMLDPDVGGFFENNEEIYFLGWGSLASSGLRLKLVIVVAVFFSLCFHLSVAFLSFGLMLCPFL